MTERQRRNMQRRLRDGQPLTATLVSSVCQDPMSGLSYPFTASVVSGGRTLKGCAAYADAMPKG